MYTIVYVEHVAIAFLICSTWRCRTSQHSLPSASGDWVLLGHHCTYTRRSFYASYRTPEPSVVVSIPIVGLLVLVHQMPSAYPPGRVLVDCSHIDALNDQPS